MTSCRLSWRLMSACRKSGCSSLCSLFLILKCLTYLRMPVYETVAKGQGFHTEILPGSVEISV